MRSSANPRSISPISCARICPGAALGAPEYFDVALRDGQIVLTPVRIQRADAVRAKLAALNITPADIADAVAWARTTGGKAARVSEQPAGYRAKPARKRKK
jgi:hypothetical protein